MDNYDQESEHSSMVEIPSTEADTSPPWKREKPVLLLDTHSQTSVAETRSVRGKATLPVLHPQQWLIAAIVAVL